MMTIKTFSHFCQVNFFSNGCSLRNNQSPEGNRSQRKIFLKDKYIYIYNCFKVTKKLSDLLFSLLKWLNHNYFRLSFLFFLLESRKRLVTLSS